jgi:hypothetical protein
MRLLNRTCRAHLGIASPPPYRVKGDVNSGLRPSLAGLPKGHDTPVGTLSASTLAFAVAPPEASLTFPVSEP